jgi:hypothetical protein
VNTDREWSESREGTSHVTLTRPPQTWLDVAKAVLPATAVRLIIGFGVLLILHAADQPAALAVAAVVAVGIVYALTARDVRRITGVHRS